MTKPVAVVFLGPSLRAEEAQRLFPRAVVRGPAKQGDVLRALRDQPRVIALIDGVFESQPSVWHQELRIALSEGVHVLGAASMGALRAVELARFGMVGVGAVYEAYASGRFVDDADVALLHADAEHGHRALTVPLVNVAATAELAVDRGVLSEREATALVRAARQVHYKDRHWSQILAALRWSAARKTTLDQFRREHARDVKAEDARLCLALARKLCSGRAEPRPMTGLSVWARRAWVAEQGAPPGEDPEPGIRTLLMAEWGQSLGLVPAPERVAFFEARAAKVPLDAGLRHRFAVALALEEQMVRHPEVLLAQAPSAAEGRWLEACRRAADRSRR